MAKNYYLILGIGSDADEEEIKSAYREQAKRWHPDHSGEGSEPFLAIREAYEVLCDPSRRRAYDEELARERRSSEPAIGGARPEALRRQRCPVEPLVPTQPLAGRHDRFPGATLQSLLAELLYQPRSDVDPPRRAQAGTEELHLEISLTPRQARHGGQFRLWIPVQLRCPACRGRGRIGAFACAHCHGRGAVADDNPIEVAFPGGLVDGSEGELSLIRPGMPDLHVVLRFKIR